MQSDYIPLRTVNQSATNSAQTIAVKGASGAAKVRVVAPTSNPLMFLKFGSASDAADPAADTPILPGAIESFIMTSGQTNASIISSTAGSGTLYFTVVGEP